MACMNNKLVAVGAAKHRTQRPGEHTESMGSTSPQPGQHEHPVLSPQSVWAQSAWFGQQSLCRKRPQAAPSRSRWEHLLSLISE